MESDIITGVGGLKFYPVNEFGITVEAKHALDYYPPEPTTGIFRMTYEQAEVLRQYLNENHKKHDEVMKNEQKE